MSDDGKDHAAEAVFAETNRLAEHIGGFAARQRNNSKANISFKDEAVEQGESLYRNEMWPLFGKIQDLAGDDQQICRMAGELHIQTLLALGELCVWAKHHERAIGMYDTALALASDDEELLQKCREAMARARQPEKEPLPKPAAKKEEELSYLTAVHWVLMGIFFMMLCLAGTVLLVYHAGKV